MAGYALAPGAPPGAVSQSGGSARTPLPKAAPSKAPAKAPAKPVAQQPTLQQQAATLANQTIAAQVAAIQQQQAAAEAQARQQAQQISLASLAASKALSGLGTPTYDAYKDAATTLAGLAGGYSGQLQTDASTEAAKVQQGLASIGSQQTATNNGQALANVLYGMRGAQPASVLLNSGAAAAAAANAAPEQILGYGQQVGQGVIGAGLQTANNLIPNILQARAQAPSLVSQYITSLTDAADKQQALANSTAATNSLITSRANTTIIDNNKAVQTAQNNVNKTKIALQNANTASARAAAEIAYQNAQTLLTTAKAKALAAGKSTSTAGGKSLTPNEVQNQLKSWYAGKLVTVRVPDTSKTSGYREVTQRQGQVSYKQAVQRLTAGGLSRAQALQAADGYYALGERGRSWLSNVQQATLKSTGHQSTVGIYKGQAFIAPAQAAALKAAGLLPAGELVAGRYFIKPGQH